MGKALDGRPRPQKQLSQPTLGASEHMEAGRLRGSQSSEGSELIHSMSLNTSSPNSATYSSDPSRDTDIGELLNNQINNTSSRGRQRKWSFLTCYFSLRWDSDLRSLQTERRPSVRPSGWVAIWPLQPGPTARGWQRKRQVNLKTHLQICILTLKLFISNINFSPNIFAEPTREHRRP